MESLFFSLESIDWRRVLVALLIAFGLGQGIAGIYVLTFRGLSYSRAMVQTLAVAALIPCMLMLAIGQSIAAALGIAGGLAIIRFRTSLRDPRDILFLFASFGGGIACGLQVFSVAIGGTAVFCGALLLMHYTAYGARNEFDGLLRFSAVLAADSELAIAGVLKASCRAFALVTLRQAAQDTVVEHAYQVSLRQAELKSKLVHELQGLPGVTDVTLLMQEPTLDL
jgi:hypothetical protein